MVGIVPGGTLPPGTVLGGSVGGVPGGTEVGGTVGGVPGGTFVGNVGGVVGVTTVALDGNVVVVLSDWVVSRRAVPLRWFWVRPCESVFD